MISNLELCAAMLTLPGFDRPQAHTKQRMALRLEFAMAALMQHRISSRELAQQMQPLVHTRVNVAGW